MDTLNEVDNNEYVVFSKERLETLKAKDFTVKFDKNLIRFLIKNNIIDTNFSKDIEIYFYFAESTNLIFEPGYNKIIFVIHTCFINYSDRSSFSIYRQIGNNGLEEIKIRKTIEKEGHLIKYSYYITQRNELIYKYIKLIYKVNFEEMKIYITYKRVNKNEILNEEYKIYIENNIIFTKNFNNKIRQLEFAEYLTFFKITDLYGLSNFAKRVYKNKFKLGEHLLTLLSPLYKIPADEIRVRLILFDIFRPCGEIIDSMENILKTLLQNTNPILNSFPKETIKLIINHIKFSKFYSISDYSILEKFTKRNEESPKDRFDPIILNTISELSEKIINITKKTKDFDIICETNNINMRLLSILIISQSIIDLKSSQIDKKKITFRIRNIVDRLCKHELRYYKLRDKSVSRFQQLQLLSNTLNTFIYILNLIIYKENIANNIINSFSDKRSEFYKAYREYITSRRNIHRAVSSFYDKLFKIIEDIETNFEMFFKLDKIDADLKLLLNNDDYKIKILTKKSQFKTTGRLLKNCIINYFGTIAEGNTILIVLYKKRKVVAAAQVNNNMNILQCRGIQNAENEYSYKLQEMIDNIKKNVDSSKYKNLFKDKKIIVKPNKTLL